MNSRIDDIFRLSEYGSDVRTEILAGLTAALATAYVASVSKHFTAMAIERRRRSQTKSSNL